MGIQNRLFLIMGLALGLTAIPYPAVAGCVTQVIRSGLPNTHDRPVRMFSVYNNVRGKMRQASFAMEDETGVFDYLHNPFPLLEHDENLGLRLQAVDHWLRKRQGRVLVYVDQFNTNIVRSWEHPEYFHPESESADDPYRFILIFQHPTDEHPQLTLHGVLTQLAFECAHDLYRNSSSWKENLASAMAVIEAHRSLGWMPPELQRRQVLDVYSHRLAWYLKVDFYERYRKRHPWLDEAPLKQAGYPFILRMMELDERDGDLFNSEMRGRFIEFYGANESQPIDPDLIEAIWSHPLPAGSELFLVEPGALIR